MRLGARFSISIGEKIWPTLPTYNEKIQRTERRMAEKETEFHREGLPMKAISSISHKKLPSLFHRIRDYSRIPRGTSQMSTKETGVVGWNTFMGRVYQWR